jgi:hypothetical protein
MVDVKNPPLARAALEAQTARIAWLRGTGPNPFEYSQWDERTQELIRAIFGADSPELERYEVAAGTRGRLPGVRGQSEDMTLNIHGQWGILGRLERAEAVLRQLVESLGQA